MKLYFSPGACSLAPHIVAREAGLPLDLVKVNLPKHTLEDGSDYYRINPRGYVPLIELDDGERMTEGSVLVQYLADAGSNRDLLPPAGTRERLTVQAWLGYVATELHKVFSPWLWHDETADSTKDSARQMLATRFAELNGILANQPYLTGDRFTVADAYAFTIVNWGNFLKFDFAPYPHLKAFLDRVAARPAVHAALVAEGLAKA